MTEPLTAQNMPIVVHAQYVKDISFESPGAPGSLRQQGPTPKMDVSINLEVKNIPDDKLAAFFEVTLQFRIAALRGDQTIFMIDLDYALAVSVDEVPEENRHAILLIEVPKLGFPFARQIISSLTRDGGFPPLLLTPVDFTSLYLERFGKQQAAASSAA
jgi:preprotein translocase subunit SecB